MEFDFAKNEVVTSLDLVPEQFRSAYGPTTDGRFGVKDEYKVFTTAVSGLNTALKAARAEAKESKSKVVDAKTLLAPLGVDSVEAAQELVEGLKQAAEKGSKVNLDKLKADIEKGFATKLEAKETENKAMLGSLQKYLVEREAVTAITAAKGSADLLLPHVKSQVKVVPDGDNYVVRVVDATGDFRGDGKGGFMGVADLVAELKSHATFGRAFESEAPGGGGARPPAPRGPAHSATLPQGDQRSPTQKIQAGLDRRTRR